MDVFQAIRERKSTRVFKTTPVPKEKVEEVLKLSICAPSALNLQPWEFYVVSGEEKGRLSRRLLKAYREKHLSCGPSTVKPLPKTYSLRGSINVESMKSYLEGSEVSFGQFINEGSCLFYGAPVAIIICIDDSFSSSHLVDIGVVLGYLLLSAHSCRLATCPIGLSASYEDEIKDLLSIPENKKIVLGVALGYPDPESPINEFKSPREELDSLVKWRE